MELTLKETNNRLPGQLASPANALLSLLLQPPICLLRTSVRPHSFPIHHFSPFVRFSHPFPVFQPPAPPSPHTHAKNPRDPLPGRVLLILVHRSSFVPFRLRSFQS